jgi:hypothetical protein
MTLPSVATRAAQVRPLIESRPPCVSPSRAPVLQLVPNQPPLDLRDTGSEDPDPAPRDRRIGGARLVKARWTAKPRPGLPDAVAWSSSLAAAMVEALLAQRPVAQLNRWLAEDVLADISRHQRRRLAQGRRPAVRVTVRSLRVQHPQPEAAEVAALLIVGRRPMAMAFRLEALGDRWLCRALELGPRPEPEC